MKKEVLDRVLNDSEKLALQLFIENDLQREAVRKVLLAEIYSCGILKPGEPAEALRNFTLGLVTEANANKADDAHLGARLRAAHEGIMLLEQGFRQLEAYKKQEERSQNNEKNPAR